MARPLLARAAIAVLLAGCALHAPRPRPILPASADGLLAGLAARRAALTSLRARARLQAGFQGAWTREALLVRRPGAVRVDVLTPFGLALALGARGDLLWAYPPNERTRYEGEASEANLMRLFGVPIRMGDIVDVLLGVPPSRTSVAPPELSLTREGEYRLTLPLDQGAQTIWFAADTLRVVRAEERRDGAVTARVAFSDYSDDFPHALEVEAPGRRAAIKLAYDAVERNAAIDPALFEPPPARRVLPLDATAPAPAPAMSR